MSINLTINSKSHKVDLKDLPIDITLNTFIREHAGLSGTKFMCLEGGCGACICVLKGRHPSSKEHRTWATNSCLTLLNSCHDLEITTIEGIGNKRKGYHPIQKRLANLNGSQCGYCSPAMVMNMYALMESNQNLTMKEIENSFGGNICRCTGYRPILDAMKSFATDTNINYDQLCGDIEDYYNKTCPKTGEICLGKCDFINSNIPYHIQYDDDNNKEWYSPKTINELFNIFKQINNKKYILVAGSTAHGVYRRPDDITVFINLNQISDLYSYNINNGVIEFGANISLTDAMTIFQRASKMNGFEYCAQLYNHFDLIANVPVRNMGTLAGNLMIKNNRNEFPSDVFITFETLNARITIIDEYRKEQTLTLLTFIKTDMTKKLITKITLKAYPNNEYLFNTYKIMPRAQNAHAYVNAGFLIQIDSNNKVLSSRICFGGISPQFTHATETENYLLGQNLFDENIIKEIFKKLSNELKPDWILPDVSSEYRKLLSFGLFYKFLLSTASVDKINSFNISGKSILEREISNGTQTFETIEKNYPITQPMPKLEALVQCAGEAFYMNDLPKQPHELWAAFVYATNVNSKIVSIDATEALAIPDVIAFYSYKDIPGVNSFVNSQVLFVPEPEEIFCSSVVRYYNQPAGVIIAKNTAIAEKAAKYVKIMYEKIYNRKIMPTLHDVFHENAVDRIFNLNTTENKNINFFKDDIHFSSILDIGSQYHFTMEPQTTICVPTEGGLTVYCATQWMDLTQLVIAKALNMKQSSVQLEVRRLGGGFGAKISRSAQIACACALACHILNRPIRFVQTIESMMGCLGKRYACHSDYEISCNKMGKISNLKNVFYEDCGCTKNEDVIAYLTVTAAHNCYDITDKWVIDGKLVLTDSPSHTFCRAPGSVEGISMIETIMEHIAFETKRDPTDVRLENIPKGHKMHELMPTFLKSIDYTMRRDQINKFNKENRWKKKGLGIAIMEYPVEYFGHFHALVSICHGDGTVCITHGGIEMGQGLFTKVAQTAAYTLQIPLEMIQVLPSNTVAGVNSFISGASITSEMVCFAVKTACETLNERLKPIKESLKNASYLEIITKAYDDNISLIATNSAAAGDLKPYKIWGLGCTEVEVDILTGNLNITRVDILEDTGESLNPTIDVGQIEGCFVMGLGYWLSEVLVFNRETGKLLTDRTWTYKPPGAKDIPIDFRINLLQKSSNSGGFLRSKTSGEPAICLSISSVFAIRHALMSARADAGLEEKWIHLGAPTTPETIVLNSGSTIDMFTL